MCSWDCFVGRDGESEKRQRERQRERDRERWREMERWNKTVRPCRARCCWMLVLMGATGLSEGLAGKWRAVVGSPRSSSAVAGSSADGQCSASAAPSISSHVPHVGHTTLEPAVSSVPAALGTPTNGLAAPAACPSTSQARVYPGVCFCQPVQEQISNQR